MTQYNGLSNNKHFQDCCRYWGGMKFKVWSKQEESLLSSTHHIFGYPCIIMYTDKTEKIAIVQAEAVILGRYHVEQNNQILWRNLYALSKQEVPSALCDLPPIWITTYSQLQEHVILPLMSALRIEYVAHLQTDGSGEVYVIGHRNIRWFSIPSSSNNHKSLSIAKSDSK